MSKDSEALYEFAHWLSEKGREAREELVYKQYTPWIDDVALGRLEAYDEAYKHCREMPTRYSPRNSTRRPSKARTRT